MTQATTDLLLRIRLESLNHSFQRMGALADSMTTASGSIARLRELMLDEPNGADDDRTSGDNVGNGHSTGDETGGESDGHVSEAAPRSGADSEPIAINKELRAVEDLLRSLLVLVRRQQDVSPMDFVRQRLSNEAVGDAKKRLELLEQTITAMKEETDALWEEANDWNYLGKRGDELSGRLEFRSTAREVDRLLGSLRTGGSIEVESAWKKYQLLMSTRTPSLFKSFVELVSGLTLRGRRLDGRVCAMAEDLLSDWEPYMEPYMDLKRALAIPALDDEVHATQNDTDAAKMMRLGFTGWTVWSLPLFAGTFWRLFADHEYRNELTEATGDEQVRQRLRTYTGDALAVKMMGPAYACSLLLLSLDPAQSEQDGLTKGFDVVRAQSAMNALTREEMSTDAIHQLLEEAWTESVSRVPGVPAPADLAHLQVVNDLANQFEDDFADRVGRLALVDASRWNRTAGFAGHALSEPPDGISPREYRSMLAEQYKDYS